MQFQHKVIPRRVISLFLNTVVKNSISISNTATFALETMNRKTAACFEEVDQSPLSEAAKDTAKTYITADVSKLMKHTTASTRAIYAVLDLLLKLFYQDSEKGQLDLAEFISAQPEPVARKSDSKKSQWPMCESIPKY